MSTGAHVHLRPLRVGELLDVAIKLCRVHFRTLGRIVLVVSAPIAVISFGVTLATAGDFPLVAGGLSGLGDTNDTQSVSTSYLAGQGIVAVLGGVVFALATVACFGAIADAYLGRDTDWKRSLRLGARKLPATAWLGIVATVGLLLAFFAAFIPAIWLGVAWSLAIPVMLVEGSNGPAALRRSFRLVRGRWWPTAGTLLVGTLLSTVLTSVVQGLLAALVILVLGENSVVALALTHITSVGVRMVTLPFTAAVIALLYFDLRVRKEAFDLQLLADEMGGGAVGAAPAFLPPAAQHGVGTGPGAPPFWPPPPGWQPPGPAVSPVPEAGAPPAPSTDTPPAEPSPWGPPSPNPFGEQPPPRRSPWGPPAEEP